MFILCSPKRSEPHQFHYFQLWVQVLVICAVWISMCTTTNIVPFLLRVVAIIIIVMTYLSFQRTASLRSVRLSRGFVGLGEVCARLGERAWA